MLKIEKLKVEGFEAAIRGMRNPMNSWDKSDSFYTHVVDTETGMQVDDQFFVGGNDLNLMMRLASGGSDDAKFRRMIIVTMDITAPLYWWKEFDTYKVGTVANSCSTMHKIHAKEFTLEDFSHEHLFNIAENCGFDEVPKYDNESWDSDLILEMVIKSLNFYRNEFLETRDKRYWWQMIQLLPSSYNQRRTVMVNYEVLHNIYHARKNHKLDEWHVLCDQIEDLPYSEVITGEESLVTLHKKALEAIKNYNARSEKAYPIPVIEEQWLTFIFESEETGTDFMSDVFELWEEDHLISFNEMLDRTHISERSSDMRPSEWSNVGWENHPFCEGYYENSHTYFIVHIQHPNKILSMQSV